MQVQVYKRKHVGPIANSSSRYRVVYSGENFLFSPAYFFCLRFEAFQTPFHEDEVPSDDLLDITRFFMLSLFSSHQSSRLLVYFSRKSFVDDRLK